MIGHGSEVVFAVFTFPAATWRRPVRCGAWSSSRRSASQCLETSLAMARSSSQRSCSSATRPARCHRLVSQSKATVSPRRRSMEVLPAIQIQARTTRMTLRTILLNLTQRTWVGRFEAPSVVSHRRQSKRSGIEREATETSIVRSYRNRSFGDCDEQLRSLPQLPGENNLLAGDLLFSAVPLRARELELRR